MKVSTSTLNNLQLRDSIDFIKSIFVSQKLKKAIVYYGWACDTENLYKDIVIDVDKIKSFIEGSEQKKIFSLGESDLYIKAPNGDFEFLLCHESDVHFGSKKRKLAQLIIESWGSKYKTFKQREGSKNWVEVRS